MSISCRMLCFTEFGKEGGCKAHRADADDARRAWSEGQSTLQPMLMMLARLGQSGSPLAYQRCSSQNSGREGRCKAQATADADDARRAWSECQSILQLMLLMLVRLGLDRVAHHRLIKANGWGDAKHPATDADDARQAWPKDKASCS